MDEPRSFDLDAAGLRADGPELRAGIEVLARALEEALPRQCTVERRSRRLFGREEVVRSVVVELGELRFGLEIEGDRVAADRRREVRGVVIKREPLELPEWVDGLVAELRRQADESAAARTALDRLVG